MSRVSPSPRASVTYSRLLQLKRHDFARFDDKSSLILKKSVPDKATYRTYLAREGWSFPREEAEPLVKDALVDRDAILNAL